MNEAVILAFAFIVRPALAQHLAIHADGCERRLEFVTDRRYEVPLLLIQLQLLGTQAIHQHDTGG